MAETVFGARNLTIRYGGEAVVDRVSFAIEAGDFVGVVGPNGAGKTTLLKALLGLVGPAGGDVHLFGVPRARFRQWSRIGYVPQNVAAVDHRFPATVLEVARLGRVARRGLLRPLSRADTAAAREALSTVGMREHESRRVADLSGGQRQRVFLAKALASEPDVLVLDEPTTGVDPAARRAFFELLDHLNHVEGKTILLVSHDTDVVLHAAHRVIALNRRIRYDGLASEVDSERHFRLIYEEPISHEHEAEGVHHDSGP